MADNTRHGLAVGRDAAVRVMRRKHRTIDLDPALPDNLESPGFAAADRKARCAEIPHRFSGDILQQTDRSAHILLESLPVLLPYELVVHRMAPDFVFFGDAPHKIRISPGDPSDHEKRRPRIRIFENPENALHILVNADRIPDPLRLGACRVIVEEMEPLLDIERKYVHTTKSVWTNRNTFDHFCGSSRCY